MSSVVKAPAPRPPQLPPIRYATVAQAVTHNSQTHTPAAASSATHVQAAASSQAQPSPSTTAPPSSAPLAASAQDQGSISASSPSLTHPSVTSPILSSAASASQQPDGSTYSAQDSPALSEAVPAKGQLLASPQKAAPVQKGERNSPYPITGFSCLVRAITFKYRCRCTTSADAANQWWLAACSITTNYRSFTIAAAGSTVSSRYKSQVASAKYGNEPANVSSGSQGYTERPTAAAACYWEPTTSLFCSAAAATGSYDRFFSFPWFIARSRRVV